MKKTIVNYSEQKRSAFAGVLQQAQQAVNEGMAVYYAIDEILWNDWDPIGVRPIAPGARDEYEDYVPDLVLLKVNNAGVEKIEEALRKLERCLAGFGEVDEEGGGGWRREYTIQPPHPNPSPLGRGFKRS